MADELIELYKAREMSVGYQFGPDTAEQNDFEIDFPYELTPDQSKSIEEIKRIWKLNVLWIDCCVEMLVTVRLRLL